jgi:hypothetical protein
MQTTYSRHNYFLSLQAAQGLADLANQYWHLTYQRTNQESAAPHVVYDAATARITTTSTYTKRPPGPSADHLQGAAHILNYLAHNTHTTWEDTRPPTIRAFHTNQAQQHMQHAQLLAHAPIKEVRAHLLNFPRPSYLLPWYDTDPDIYTSPHLLYLTPQARALYAQLAHINKMQPRHTQRTQTAFVTCTLEAIGLHYLTPEVHQHT